MTKLYLVACNVDGPAGPSERYFFSVLPPEVIFRKGLIGEAIVGECAERPLEGAAIERSKFAANSIFKEFLHRVIASCSALPAIVAEAQRIGRGTVTVIDKRVPNLNAAIAPADIFGGFTVEGGKVTGYIRNPNHVLLNEHGFFSLEPAVDAALLKALEEKCKS